MSKALELLNEQMNFEYESAYVYKAMAAYTDRLEMDGFTHWFDHQVAEEIEHGEKMKHFLQEVGYDVRYKAIPEPQYDYESLLDVFKAALAHEKEVTRRIHEIAEVSKDEDLRVFSFIQAFIDEQVEEEDSVSKIVTKLERAKDNWGALYILDGQMFARG
ncbi:ferritin [Anaerococcus sp. NML200574]|uniref:ferritin n=1 Tax=Anaerococcus sp. NML200574 TaxID=2954486 RepID=UPI002236F6D4|nr:ferritin [Anaerococcus sp. NML200574]MCW6677581.1 ferritin [Anaerococcus sp. NML200574]